MKILINPRHGGSNPSEIGFNLNERDVVLSIGKHVVTYLRAVGYDVKLFQYDGLQTICDDANAFHADLFVSIHCNAATGNAKDAETYWSGFSQSSKRLAEKIQAQLVDSLPLTNRGVKSENFYVLKNTDMPDALDASTKAIASGLSKHFDASEFVCHCCGRGSVDTRLIELLEELRAKAGSPIHINCGYRCLKHNAEVGGVPNSQHVLGTAVDCR